MGRDGTGIRIDKKHNAKGVKLNGVSHDTASQITTESSETKKIVVEDRTVKDLLDEECQEKQDVLGVKNINCEVGPPEEKSVIPDTQKSSEKTLRSPVKPASGSDNFKMNSKVSQSFRYMTGTQASGSTLYPNLRCSPRIKDSHTPKNAEHLELPSRTTAKKLQPDHRKFYDDEDNWSMASSAAASVRTVRSVTVPVAPSFSSAGRIAKRKEFYKMLEEKHKALEAEKREYEARMKEEQAAAIKQLRKSMAYKAKPVPSFYHEGPPPKVEPKKKLCKGPVWHPLWASRVRDMNQAEGTVEVKDESHAQSGEVVKPDRGPNSKLVESSNTCYKGNNYPHDFSPWLNFHPDSNNVQLCQMSAFDGQLYPVSVDNRFQHVPINIFTPYPFDPYCQDFHYFVVIDFEATCDKAKNPHPQEIIELPSVIVSSLTGRLEACFQTYVRPTCNQMLSEFCKDLTGIQQIQVDRGVTLSEALLRHDKWLEKRGIKGTNFTVVTWSNWDCRVMLESECRYKKICKPPYFDRWINLKVPFQDVFGNKRCNLKEAVEMAGLVWQGRAHCGLDDAKNTARLLALIMRKGYKFSITNSMMHQSPEYSMTWKHPVENLPCTTYHPMKLKDAHVPMIQLSPFCYCGVKSSKGMVRKPGPKQGSCFFGCGNWTAAIGARCQYFEWASA